MNKIEKKERKKISKMTISRKHFPEENISELSWEGKTALAVICEIKNDGERGERERNERIWKNLPDSCLNLRKFSCVFDNSRRKFGVSNGEYCFEKKEKKNQQKKDN